MEGSTKDLFINFVGLSAQKAEETLKNANLTKNLIEVINLTKKYQDFTPSLEKGKLFYSLASSQKLSKESQEILADYIISGKIPNVPQLEAAAEFLIKNSSYAKQDFEAYCGIGVEVTEDQLNQTISELIKADENKIKESGWEDKGLPGNLLKKLKTVHKWGNPVLSKQIIDQKLEALLGPKPSEEELKKSSKVNKKKKIPVEEPSKKEKLSTYMGRELKSAINSEELTKKHLEFTGGKVITRFPPEPNGYLHIGHAKAMRFNFTVAQENEGHTYLRFDDTNPDKESKEFIENIKKNVSWLGYTPWKVTHASEYFPEMHTLAVQLIEWGKAYVDFQPWALIREQRSNKIESPYRNASIEENLKHFERMKKGYYAEGEACLRMKIDMSNDNPCMRDPVAYRIKFSPHPHVGDLWCIYPTYDFEHCIVDSIENITHSLCTLEFEIRRDSYYWLLEALDLYRASVWEYSRLNITYMMMSKRRLQAMVEGKIVNGWDDPRLPTLNGLKRRGYTAEAINAFVDEIGVARTGNNIISIKLLENFIRKELDEKAPRTMAVIDPLRVNIVNFKQEITLEVPFYPKLSDSKKYVVHFTPTIFIEQSDFLEIDFPKFHGLSINKVVGLKYVSLKIKCVKVNKNSDKIESLDCEIVEDQSKPQGVLHWISDADSVQSEVRIYDYLFKSENPAAIDNWLEDINPNSLVIAKDALINKNLLAAVPEDKFQFERLGYFVVDPDSSESLKVFNRIVKLVENKKKKET